MKHLHGLYAQTFFTFRTQTFFTFRTQTFFTFRTTYVQTYKYKCQITKVLKLSSTGLYTISDYEKCSSCPPLASTQVLANIHLLTNVQSLLWDATDGNCNVLLKLL